jgi:hypothetical protein
MRQPIHLTETADKEMSLAKAIDEACGAAIGAVTDTAGEIAAQIFHHKTVMPTAIIGASVIPVA